MVSQLVRVPEGSELEPPPPHLTPPKPHPDETCLRSSLPDPHLPPDLSTCHFHRGFSEPQGHPPCLGCGGLPAPCFLLGEPGGWAMGTHPAPLPPRNRPRGSHPERLPNVRPQWQGRGEQGRVSGSWPGCGEAPGGTASSEALSALWATGAFTQGLCGHPRLPRLLPPLPRFKQLLLTQADKFSQAEVRTPPLWGSSPQGPQGASWALPPGPGVPLSGGAVTLLRPRG